MYRLIYNLSIAAFCSLLCSSTQAQEARKLFETPFTYATESFGADTGALALAPDAKMLALGGSDRTLRLVEFPSGREVRVLEALSGVPNRALFSPDGKWLAVRSFLRDEKKSVAGIVVTLFNVQTGVKMWENTALRYGGDMAFWPAQKELALSGVPLNSGNGTSVTLVLDLTEGTEKRRLPFSPQR